MSKDNKDDDTRAILAKRILLLLGVIAVALLVLFAFQQKLGLSRDAVAMFQNIFSGLFGLTLIAFVFYFRKRT